MQRFVEIGPVVQNIFQCLCRFTIISLKKRTAWSFIRKKKHAFNESPIHQELLRHIHYHLKILNENNDQANADEHADEHANEKDDDENDH